MSQTYRYDDGTVFIGNPDLSGKFVVYAPPAIDEHGAQVIAGDTLLRFICDYLDREGLVVVKFPTLRPEERENTR